MEDLKPHEFMPAAEQLKPGQKARVEHCGMGSPMYVSNGRQGYSAYCFRCGGKGFVPHQLSLAERIEQFAAAGAADEQAKADPRLPEPRLVDPQQWPDEARVWLYKGGFSNDDILNLGFYYHEKMQRVVMPVYQNGSVVYWQARGFVKDLAKAINPSVDRTGLVAKYGSSDKVIALTEDILSAAKMACACEAWALLGTKMDDAVLASLIRRDLPVILALDDDAAGRAGADRIARRLRTVGIPAHAIYFGKDPKLVPRKDIHEAVQNYLRRGAEEPDL